jgi:hypothetical protein
VASITAGQTTLTFDETRKLRRLHAHKARHHARSPPTEFARNFGQYREIAQREPVAVTSQSRAIGYFVSAVALDLHWSLKVNMLSSCIGRNGV